MLFQRKKERLNTIIFICCCLDVLNIMTIINILLILNSLTLLIIPEKKTLRKLRYPKRTPIFKTEHDHITIQKTLERPTWRKTFHACGFVGNPTPGVLPVTFSPVYPRRGDTSFSFHWAGACTTIS